MTDLPEGWEWSTLGEIGSYLNGRGFKKSEWRDMGRPIIRIQNLTGSGEAFNYFDGEADERHVVRDGDLLVSWAATLGVYVWRGPEAVLNQHIFKVESNIYPAFHRWLLESSLAELMRQTHGSGMVHITKGRFDETPVRIPPIDEQERIVAAVEEHLSRLDAAQAALDAAAARASVLARRVLDEATDERWPSTCLEAVLAQPLANGRSVVTQPGGFPVLRLTALRERRILLEERKEGAWTAAQAEPFLVKRGDFLVSRGNGSLSLVGRGGLVTDDPDPVAYPDTLIRVRVRSEECDASFLSYVWDSSAIRHQIERNARTTAGIYKINQEMLRQIRIPLPPIDAQRRITESVESALASSTRLSNEIDRASARAAALRRSILAAAFSGRLVLQNPDDEPASALLERIQAERAAAGPTRRSRKAKSA